MWFDSSLEIGFQKTLYELLFGTLAMEKMMPVVEVLLVLFKSVIVDQAKS